MTDSKVEEEKMKDEGGDEMMTSTTTAATWDLTSRVSPYLDLHMMFPLLEYVDSLISSGLIPYSTQDVAAARLSLLRPTHMVDYAMDIYRELHGGDAEIPAEMEEQKAKVFERLEELRNGCRAFDELCHNDNERAQLAANGEWNLKSLSQMTAFGVTPEVVQTYRELAKYNFDCGDYQTARDMLENYLSLFASPPQPAPAPGDDDDDDETSLTDAKAAANKAAADAKGENVGNPQMYYLTTVDMDLLQVLWGKLACEILLESWEEAGVALTAVKTAIESLAAAPASSPNKITALEALRQRTWLLHWSLFVFWNDSTRGLENMVDLYTTERYLQAITTNAPHLLRYLTAAVLLSKRRVAKRGGTNSAEARRLMKDLVKVMQHCDYTDPIVDFVDCLCVKFDFDSAQKKLAQCEQVLMTDFFLCKQTDLFMEEARVFIFENYCRIHHKIDLGVLGEKLAMDQDQAERWIVDLIRNALLDAKIDSEEKCVVMGTDTQSVYEQVMERTRDLNVRSGTLAQNLANVLNDAKKEKAKRARAALEEDG